ncbi:hypothetical protein L1987_23486 [Smallanthus sonchifolius]|uniref:Uncharacterized protein n=1 Tax=Smallanthus sonchifolius TaxID=185202 RepID=A0ACB9IJ99_9ASTR|nr:hypothetical protein L1987_23486 [Smallanthus sonchifolius]
MTLCLLLVFSVENFIRLPFQNVTFWMRYSFTLYSLNTFTRHNKLGKHKHTVETKLSLFSVFVMLLLLRSRMF